jgi:toxin-antitoxin system PIN domain toxin
VTLVDANILLYAANRSAPEHDVARDWLDERLSGSAPVGLPWPSLLAFVRLATNPLVVSHPVSMEKAWGQVEEWLSPACAWVPTPGERHRDLMGAYCRAPWMTSRLVPDAHLAAIAVEHGLRLCSSDADFARFPGLDWFNPLAA